MGGFGGMKMKQKLTLKELKVKGFQTDPQKVVGGRPTMAAISCAPTCDCVEFTVEAWCLTAVC